MQIDNGQWLDGFVEKCAEAGLTPEQTSVMLEMASMNAMLTDSDFAEGFNARMDAQQ